MKKLNQNGAVAMISVVIFALIITIIATAYARTIVSQQRESINYDLSTRAYYAAEAGVQDAIRYLRTPAADGGPNDVAQNGQSSCVGPANQYLGGSTGKLDDNGNIAYTCQLVDITPGSLDGITSTSSDLWRIEPADSSSTGYVITVSWRPIETPPTDSYEVPLNGDKLFPPISNWKDEISGAKYPPVFRVSFISNSQPGSPSRSSLSQKVYFLNPLQTAESVPDISAGQTLNSIVHNAQCTTSEASGYSCSASFKVPESEFAGKELFAVVHSVYGNSSYKITMAKQANLDEVGFKGTAATIDVTARAGNVFRRVQQQVSLSNGYQKSWFDASGLVVGDGICKLFSVGKSESQFNSRCNPLDPSSP